MSFFLDQLDRETKSTLYKEITEQPSVEVVSVDETYLLDDKGRRERRICGYTKDGSWPCQCGAGLGTHHVGIGRCKKHASGIPKSFIKKVSEEILKDESSLKKLAVDSEELEVFDVEDLLKLLYVLLEEHIKKSQFKWSKKDTEHAIQIIEQMRKMIETHQKKEQQQLNTLVIISIFKNMLDVISKYVSVEVLGKIKTDISLMELPKEVTDIEFKEM